jgi:hypothetical protein
MALCESCKMQIPTMEKRLRLVNNTLWQLGLEYHKHLPVHALDYILTSHGFNPTSVWTFQPGGEVRIHEEVGEGKWLSVAAHKMDSGLWEVTAYVN